MSSVRTAVVALTLLLVAAHAAASDQIIFVVRHAERASSATAPAVSPMQPMTAAEDDPPLSAAGHERAARLASMLRIAGIKHVFSTEYLRTRQTAAPTAQALHLEVSASSAKDTDALVETLRKVTGNALVVGHSNTVPELLKRLGVTEEIRIPDSEYDNLFVVVRRPSGQPTLIRLRY